MVTAILGLITAVVSAISGIVGGAMKNAAANVAGIRKIRDDEISYNQQKDLAAYQVAGQQIKTEGLILVVGLAFLSVMIIMVFLKKK